MSQYVVAEVNQASNWVEVVHGPYQSLQDATEEAQVMRALTARAGRRERYYVAELEPLEEAS